MRRNQTQFKPYAARSRRFFHAALAGAAGAALSGFAVILAAVALCVGSVRSAKAKEVGCIDAKIISQKLITDVCWDCVFPIKVAGVAVSGSKHKNRVPDGAATQPFCMCWDNQGVPKPGVTTQFWQPNRLVEYQRVSGCSSVLNGVRFPFNRLNQGTQEKAEERPGEGELQTYRHYHFYAFPVMLMLDIFVPGHCNPGAFHDLDVMYLSEVDPTWKADELAFFANPEAALIATPLAATACVPDAVASNVRTGQGALLVRGFLGDALPLHRKRLWARRHSAHDKSHGDPHVGGASSARSRMAHHRRPKHVRRRDRAVPSEKPIPIHAHVSDSRNGRLSRHRGERSALGHGPRFARRRRRSRLSRLALA